MISPMVSLHIDTAAGETSPRISLLARAGGPILLPHLSDPFFHCLGPLPICPSRSQAGGKHCVLYASSRNLEENG